MPSSVVNFSALVRRREWQTGTPAASRIVPATATLGERRHGNGSERRNNGLMSRLDKCGA